MAICAKLDRVDGSVVERDTFAFRAAAEGVAPAGTLEGSECLVFFLGGVPGPAPAHALDASPKADVGGADLGAIDFREDSDFAF